MKKKQKETWRELIRQPRELSWREWGSIWGVGVAGGVCVVNSAYGLFIREDPPAALCLGWFLIGAVCIAVTVSKLLTRCRRLTDRGLLRAGVIYRAGILVLGPVLLVMFYPWARTADGLASFAERIVICAITLALSAAFGGVPLVRLVNAYRHRDREEEKKVGQEKPQKIIPAKMSFWFVGLVLLVTFLLCLVAELKYLAVKAEYEDLNGQRIEVYTGRRQEKDFDEARYNEVSDTYHVLDRWVHGRKHSAETGLTLLGIGLFLWFLALLGRLIGRAARNSVERDERREQKRLEGERERQRDRDPWE